MAICPFAIKRKSVGSPGRARSEQLRHCSVRERHLQCFGGAYNDELPVVAFVDSKSHLAQGLDHYRVEEFEGNNTHRVFWDGSKTGKESSVCLTFDAACSFKFNAGIDLNQFSTKGASPFISALHQPKTIANIEKSLVSLTTFANDDEISIASNVLVYPTSVLSLPTVDFCCALLHHVDFAELAATH